MQHVSREVALLSSTKVQTYRATKAAFLCERCIFRKRAFGCWMAFIPPLHPIQMSSCRSPSRLPWVKDSTSIRRILDTRASSLFQFRMAQLAWVLHEVPHDYFRFIKLISVTSASSDVGEPTFQSLLCLSLRFAWVGNVIRFCKKDKSQ